MTGSQRLVALAIAGASALALLFPPFRYDVEGKMHGAGAGYHFLLDPPSVDVSLTYVQAATVYATVHVAGLIGELLGIALIGAALFLALRAR